MKKHKNGKLILSRYISAVIRQKNAPMPVASSLTILEKQGPEARSTESASTGDS